VLEASYIVFRLPPFFANFGKRLIKSPKLYFYDTGLAAALLNIETPRQLENHPLRGALFETWVTGEIAKAYLHRGRRPRLSFYRDSGGLEIDLILEKGTDLVLVEIKSARTPSGQYFNAFERFTALGQHPSPGIAGRIVVYGGDESQPRSRGTLLSWRELDAFDWAGSAA
jgi:predicted AAA+ superfamily ATPase